MADTTSFQLRLSPGELFYVAGVLGLRQIILIGQPFSGWVPEKVQAQKLKGRQTLEERGWLRPSTSGLVIDKTFAGMIQVVAEPKIVVEISSYKRGARGSQMAIYPLPGGLMTVCMDGPDYLFTIHAPGAFDPFALIRQAGINTQHASATSIAPVSGHILFALMNEYLVYQLALIQIQKMHPPECEWIMVSLPLIEFCVTLSLHRWENSALNITAAHNYVGNTNELWQVLPNSKPAAFIFQPVAAGQIFRSNLFEFLHY